ncbi:Oxo-4-hydroxy-4-carboxy-5-ureidoimidazoline decarboxylase, partial [Syncephalis pseudoplumigaleata]
LPALPLISELNTLPDAQFLAAVNLLFETAPPLAQRLLARRPYTSYEELISVAEAIVLDDSRADSGHATALTDEEVLQVVNAHPRIGAPATALSTLSQREQGGGGGRTGDADPVALAKTLEQLAELNAAYEAKYGFRFIVFVNGRSRAEIVPVLEERLAHGRRDEEIRTALEAMIAIARDRLNKMQ